MTTTSNAWTATAAYLYVLRLDAPSLAWEYLRRNPIYQQVWKHLGKSAAPRDAKIWGLQFRGRSGV